MTFINPDATRDGEDRVWRLGDDMPAARYVRARAEALHAGWKHGPGLMRSTIAKNRMNLVEMKLS